MINESKLKSVTRGNGLLGSYLAGRRASMANKLIPDSHRHGRILDIGCGTSPYFLSHTHFKEKFGIDTVIKQNERGQDVALKHFDVEEGKPLPFEGENFEVVTMLAVFEHIKPQYLPKLLNEAYRVLKF